MVGLSICNLVVNQNPQPLFVTQQVKVTCNYARLSKIFHFNRAKTLTLMPVGSDAFGLDSKIRCMLA